MGNRKDFLLANEQAELYPRSVIRYALRHLDYFKIILFFFLEKEEFTKSKINASSTAMGPYSGV